MAPTRKAIAATRRSKRIKSNADASAAPTHKDNVPTIAGPPPTLLTIAPELRNRISSYVLQSDGPIQITPSLREPAYLLTNRQIRSEARALWYHGNDFRVMVTDCNGDTLTAFMVFLERINMMKKQPIAVNISVTGTPHWDNLARWCHDIHASNCTLPMSGSGRKSSRVVVAALEMVNSMPDGKWEDCLGCLNCLRAAVGAYDPRWLE